MTLKPKQWTSDFSRSSWHALQFLRSGSFSHRSLGKPIKSPVCCQDPLLHQHSSPSRAHGLWNPCDQAQAAHPLPPNCWRASSHMESHWRAKPKRLSTSALPGGRETVALSSREHIPTPMAVSCWAYGAEPTVLTQWEPSPCSSCAPLHYLPPLWDPAEWLWLASGQLSRRDCSPGRQRCWLE